MKQYYQDLITDKSWQMLLDLNQKIKFTLIGGWAVYLYTQSLKSKDIDMIVDYETLDKLRADYDLVKNDRLRKYEIVREGVNVDVYLPYYSSLVIPVEDLIKYTQKLDRFIVLQKEMLLLTKQKAFFARKGSPKGEKDKIDIIVLTILDDFNFEIYRKLIKEFNLDQYITQLMDIYQKTKEVPELGFNQHGWARKKRQMARMLE